MTDLRSACQEPVRHVAKKKSPASTILGAGSVDVLPSMRDPEGLETIARIEGHLVDLPFILLRWGR